MHCDEKHKNTRREESVLSRRQRASQVGENTDQLPKKRRHALSNRFIHRELLDVRVSHFLEGKKRGYGPSIAKQERDLQMRAWKLLGDGNQQLQGKHLQTPLLLLLLLSTSLSLSLSLFSLFSLSLSLSLSLAHLGLF